MKLLIMILLLPCFSFAECWVTTELDQDGCNVIKCTKGFTPNDMIHKAPLDNLGNVVKYGCYLKTALKTVPDPLNPGETKQITVYEFDPVKKAAAIQARVDAESARQVAETLRQQRRDRIKAGCAAVVDTLIKDMCEEVSGL